MNEKLAIELLMAQACCSITGLTCDECPLYREPEYEEEFADRLSCRPWTDEEIVEAVRFLKKEGIV